jgi:C1A family cysteine protease
MFLSLSVLFTLLVLTANQVKANNIEDETPGISWSLSFEDKIPQDKLEQLGGSDQAIDLLKSSLAEKLPKQGISITSQAGASGPDAQLVRTTLQGQTSLDQLREILYTDLPPVTDLIGGPADLILDAPVSENQLIDIILESRPATGYAWDLSALSTGAFQVLGEEYTDQSGVLGGSARQVLHLKATTTGAPTLQLNYRRSWEGPAQPSHTLAVKMSSYPQSMDISSPKARLNVAPLDVESQIAGPQAPSITEALPPSYDLRPSGYVTPIRNQGGCGSCWAFATVGAMESAMLYHNLPSTDLSEQFLVSCNQSGYSCSGGWWTHDYHFGRLGKNQTAAGAVLESAKPYTAQNGTCDTAYSHPYKLSSWNYVSTANIPTVTEIKQAIYSYGGISAAVCVGSKFQSYTSGIFSTDESSTCGTGKVNHGIVLVGWNDTEQTWILRNSWGSWGESGYMRIKWNISNVGYGATYVDFPGTDPVPTPTPTPTTPPTATPVPTQPTKTPTAQPTSTPTRTPTFTPQPTQPSAPVANDEIINAKVIEYSGGPISYYDNLDTRGATSNTSDPAFPGGLKYYNTVWYKFTPASTGSLVVSTNGSSYDTVLALWKYTGAGVKRIKWNDNKNSTNLQATLNVASLVSGNTYLIEVASKKQGGGSMKLQTTFNPVRPINDEYRKATTITKSIFAQTLDIWGATSLSDPVLPIPTSRTIWYKITSRVKGVLTLNTANSNFDTFVAVYSGTSTLPKTQVGWNDDVSTADKTSNLQINTNAGVTYWIEVGSHTNETKSVLSLKSNFVSR